MRDATHDALKLEDIGARGKEFLLFSKATDAFLEICKQAARMTGFNRGPDPTFKLAAPGSAHAAARSRARAGCYDFFPRFLIIKILFYP
jgi:hypothetical protein